MHDDRVLTEQRLERVLRERIRPAVHGAAVPLQVAAWHAPGEPVPPAEGLAAEYQPFAVGTAWGRPWGTTWFSCRGQVPAEWAGRDVAAIVDLGFGGGWPGFAAEGLIYLPTSRSSTPTSDVRAAGGRAAALGDPAGDRAGPGHAEPGRRAGHRRGGPR